MQSRGCTIAAGTCAVLGNVLSAWATVHALNSFAPGTHIRFVIAGGLVAIVFVVVTFACAIGGMAVDHRYLANIAFVVIAVTAVPLEHYVFWRVVDARHLVAEP